MKHVLAPSRDGVIITVSAKRSAGGIEFQVIDDGGGKSRVTLDISDPANLVTPMKLAAERQNPAFDPAHVLNWNHS